MKRNLLAWPLGPALVTAFVALSVSSVFAAPPVHHTLKNVKHAHAKHIPSAPADEYFGRQKLSILGVRNTVHDLKIRYDGTVQRSAMVLNAGTGVEDAMRIWAKRYPGDLWLAHNAFQLDQIYMRVPTAEGRAHTKIWSDWIIHQYPHTYYGRYLTHIRALAAAHPTHTPDDNDATEKPSPSPSPSSPLPSPSPGVSETSPQPPIINKTPVPGATPM